MACIMPDSGARFQALFSIYKYLAPCHSAAGEMEIPKGIRPNTVFAFRLNWNMKHSILLHEPGDDVGVAVLDLKKGASASAVTLEGKPAGSVKLRDNVPLGHKVAMRDVDKDKPIIKYGRQIGKAVKPIAKGAHVHTHNLKTMRWSL